MIRQSLAINRSLAYVRHADLVAKVVLKPPGPGAGFGSKGGGTRSYALTLDVDRF